MEYEEFHGIKGIGITLESIEKEQEQEFWEYSKEFALEVLDFWLRELIFEGSWEVSVCTCMGNSLCVTQTHK